MESVKNYKTFPKISLEEKIKIFVRLMEQGWSRNYSRTNSGLCFGCKDYYKALEDSRVQNILEKNHQDFLNRQRKIPLKK